MAEDVVAVPSTAPEDAPARDFTSFEAEALARDSGRPQIAPKPADSAAAKPVDQVASTDAVDKPASEPGKPKEKGAKARSAELDAEIVEMREKLRIRAVLKEELARGDAKPAESSPAPPKATSKASERYKAMPDAPKLDEYQTYEDWSVDMADFAATKRLEEYSQQQRHEYESGKFQEAHTKFDAKGVEAFPDFREVLTAAAQSGRQWPEYVTKAVLTHEQGHAIAYALAQAKDDHALYARLADPVEAGMVIGEILAQQKPPSLKPVTRISRAPDPPQTLGTRPNDKGDPMRAALANDDFSSFEAAFLAKERAKSA